MAGRVAGFRSLKFPTDVADRMEQAAGGMGLTPAEWALAYLDEPVVQYVPIRAAQLKLNDRADAALAIYEGRTKPGARGSAKPRQTGGEGVSRERTGERTGQRQSAGVDRRQDAGGASETARPSAVQPPKGAPRAVQPPSGQVRSGGA